MRPYKLDTIKLFELFKAKFEKDYNEINSLETIQFKLELDKLMTPKKPVELLFTQRAYDKMNMLTQESAIEVAWHGLVTRTPQGFKVSDILIYPQLAAATTVESIDEDYAKWLSQLSDDEINSMKLQGHSHVNMGVTPSGLDQSNQLAFLANVKDYYIFIIFNKHESIWVRIYDIENDVIYSNTDVNVVVPRRPYELWAKSALNDYVRVVSIKYVHKNFTKPTAYDDDDPYKNWDESRWFL